VDEVYLTEEGAARFRAELDELRGSRREDLARRLRSAIQQGDLSENADYIAAKEEQAFLEGRIQDLEALLREAVIVDSNQVVDTVQIGTVVLVQIDEHPAEEYQLVGTKEADARRNKISHASPIGRAIKGRREGETSTAVTPAGEMRVTILEIR
jgi:transcription elongation factor GreA